MVYVDTPFKAKVPGKPWPWWSHMLADTEEELHRMARKIGLKPEWFQNNNIPHYDVTISKRRRALAAGAKEITRKETVELIRRLRDSL